MIFIFKHIVHHKIASNAAVCVNDSLLTLIYLIGGFKLELLNDADEFMTTLTAGKISFFIIIDKSKCILNNVKSKIMGVFF